MSTLPILGPDLPIALLFGRHKTRLRRSGASVADADLTIAAIGLSRGATLVTGSARHYDQIDGLPVEDWIDRSPPTAR